MDAIEVLPAGTRLLHVGPPKTGTTTLQSAFHHHRAELERLGVHYAGRTSQVRAAASLVAFGERVPGMAPESVGEWADLVHEVTASRARRVVVSSETFAHCDDEAARRVVDAFGSDRTHVVLTARPLAAMLPSSWQQYVQGGQRTGYERWLASVLQPGTKPVTPGFWRRTRFDHVAARWADALGPDRVTVVSLAAAPREFVLRAFERLTGLPDGVLVPDPNDENPSLPHPMVELLRHFNARWAAGPDPSRDARARIVEFGAIAALRDLDDVDLQPVRTRTPAWATQRANEVAAEMNAGLRALGVRVVGDLDALAAVQEDEEQAADPSDSLPPAEAAALLHTMVIAARREAARDSDLEWLGTADLVRAARRRLAQRFGERVTARVRGSHRLHRLLPQR